MEDQFAVLADNVIEIVAQELSRFDLIARTKFEELLRDIPRQMRFGDAQRQEERLAVKVALELIGRPFAGNIVFGLWHWRLAGAPGKVGAAGLNTIHRRRSFLPQLAFVGGRTIASQAGLAKQAAG
jgi:hypothetical protein